MTCFLRQTTRGEQLAEMCFFHGDRSLSAQLRERLQREQRLEGLADATGLQDPQLLAHLADAQFDASSLAALTLLPTVFVAWADGWVTAEEREQIMTAARQRGIQSGSTAEDLLRSWLRDRPSSDLWQLWHEFAASMSRELPSVWLNSLAHEIYEQAELVARASGGLFGIGPISTAEMHLLGEIRAAFTMPRPAAAG